MPKGFKVNVLYCREIIINVSRKDLHTMEKASSKSNAIMDISKCIIMNN